MERKIGEIFNFHGVVLQVYEAEDKCKGCFFENYPLSLCLHQPCISIGRKDKKDIIFKKIILIKMTREEQIISEAKKHYYDDINCHNSFLHGVEWADEHPVDVWHDASEKPKENSKIVIVDTKGEWWNIDNYVSDDFDGCGLYGWDFCIVHYDLKIWAYTRDLLPKGGEK